MPAKLIVLYPKALFFRQLMLLFVCIMFMHKFSHRKTNLFNFDEGFQTNLNHHSRAQC